MRRSLRPRMHTSIEQEFICHNGQIQIKNFSTVCAILRYARTSKPRLFMSIQCCYGRCPYEGGTVPFFFRYVIAQPSWLVGGPATTSCSSISHGPYGMHVHEIINHGITIHGTEPEVIYQSLSNQIKASGQNYFLHAFFLKKMIIPKHAESRLMDNWDYNRIVYGRMSILIDKISHRRVHTTSNTRN